MKRLILSAVLLVVGLMAVQAQKFVLVDMEYIMKQIPAVTQANQQMEALSKLFSRTNGGDREKYICVSTVWKSWMGRCWPGQNDAESSDGLLQYGLYQELN